VPPGNQMVYGTLPHAPRNSQNLDVNDVYVQQKAPDYSTLPHNLRNVEQKGSSHQFDSKSYERYEPTAHMSTFSSHKRSPSGDSISRNISLGKYGCFVGIYQSKNI
jgi:hypothetical protein